MHVVIIASYLQLWSKRRYIIWYVCADVMGSRAFAVVAIVCTWCMRLLQWLLNSKFKRGFCHAGSEWLLRLEPRGSTQCPISVRRKLRQRRDDPATELLWDQMTSHSFGNLNTIHFPGSNCQPQFYGNIPWRKCSVLALLYSPRSCSSKCLTKPPVPLILAA